MYVFFFFPPRPMGKSEAYESIWMIVDAITTEFHKDPNLFVIPETHTPEFLDQCRRLSSGFAATAKNMTGSDNIDFWNGQLGCIDGMVLNMFSPTSAVEDPSRYNCPRKGMFGLLLIAICDQNRRFLWWSLRHPPSTHDSMSWRDTTLGYQVTHGLLPKGFFFNGCCNVSNAISCYHVKSIT